MDNRLKQGDLIRARALLIQRQGYSCPLCCTKLTMGNAAVDHDHRTGAIRDALCTNCNGLEGKLWNIATRGRRHHKHTDYLGRVILYWLKHETNQTGLYHPTHKSEDEKRVRRNAKAKAARLAKKGK